MKPDTEEMKWYEWNSEVAGRTKAVEECAVLNFADLMARIVDILAFGLRMKNILNDKEQAQN
jgi:hypothetical protein